MSSNSVSKSCVFKCCRSTWKIFRPLVTSTIYPWRHSKGSTVSRLGLWEFYQELNVIREEGIVIIGHSVKYSMYHVLVRRSKSNLNVPARKLRAVYTVFRDSDETIVNQIWDQVASIINALLPFLKPYLYLTEIRMLTDIMKIVTCDNPNYTSAHVAAKLQLMPVFNAKNKLVIDHLNDRVEPIGQTPLMIAIQSQNFVLVKLLVDLGASLLLTDFRSDSILHYAALSNNIIFKYLLDRVKSKHNLLSMLRRRNNKGYLPLHWCCYSGHVENMCDLLRLSLPSSLLLLEPQVKSKSNNKVKKCNSLSDDLTGIINYKESEVTNTSHGTGAQQGHYSRTLSSSGSERNVMVCMTIANDEKIVFTSEMIADLDPSEMMLGGSPIHWAKTRRLLENLLENTNIPLDAVNFKQETPLHVMTRRRRLKCAVILLSRGVDVLAQDAKGNTPMHRAVQKEDISMVQALIAFDSDINGLNNRRQTPRHIAATKGSAVSSIIVNVLHRVGAKRCPPGRKKCKDDCAHEAKGIGTSFPKWVNYENESPYEDFMNVRGAEIERKLSKCNNPARMICLDGGGTRGLFTCCALIEIERRLKKPLREYFEWWVGTSSGALIASLIVLGTPLHQIRSMYYQTKDKIFTGPRPYNSELLEKLMKERMGPSTKMDDIKDGKRLLITAVTTHHNPAELYMFRNIPSTTELLNPGEEPVSPPKSPPSSSKSNASLPNLACNYKDHLIWHACRASGAAPSYFSAFGPFIDGGVLSNNPTLDGMCEFFQYNRALETVNKKTEIQQLTLVLSMGTGKAPILPAHLVDIGPIMASSIFTLPEALKTALSLQELVHMMITTTLQTDGHVNKRAQAWCSSLSIPYYRLTPPMSEELLLNVTDDIEIVNGMWETKAYMYALSPFLDSLVRTLESPVNR